MAWHAAIHEELLRVLNILDAEDTEAKEEEEETTRDDPGGGEEESLQEDPEG